MIAAADWVIDQKPRQEYEQTDETDGGGEATMSAPAPDRSPAG